MKKLTAIFLLFAFSFQVCSKLVIAGWFSINRQEITALFCVNKQNPDSQCKGNCYLNKKLKEADTETQQGSTVPVKHKTTTEEVWILDHQSLVVLPFSQSFSFAVQETHCSTQGFICAIFQPPRV